MNTLLGTPAPPCAESWSGTSRKVAGSPISDCLRTSLRRPHAYSAWHSRVQRPFTQNHRSRPKKEDILYDCTIALVDCFYPQPVSLLRVSTLSTNSPHTSYCILLWDVDGQPTRRRRGFSSSAPTTRSNRLWDKGRRSSRRPRITSSRSSPTPLSCNLAAIRSKFMDLLWRRRRHAAPCTP